MVDIIHFFLFGFKISINLMNSNAIAQSQKEKVFYPSLRKELIKDFFVFNIVGTCYLETIYLRACLVYVLV